jgi:restriction endonuclease S subunit
MNLGPTKAMNSGDRQACLGDIADIKSGLTLRGPNAARPTSQLGLHYLRISDLTKDGRVALGNVGRIHVSPESIETHRLRRNDVVLANRGNRLTSALFDKQFDAVAGSQFYVLRVRDQNVLPEFLRWFLNLDTTTAFLAAKSTGSYIKSLPVGELRTLPIPIPSLETQRIIVAVAELRIREKKLIARLENLRETLLQQTLYKAASKDGSPPRNEVTKQVNE